MKSSNALHTVLSAGEVLRCHTFPVLNRQTVGLHTWRALTILHWLYHPGLPPPKMTYNLLMHDVAELYTGDMRGDTKGDNPELAGALDLAEERFLGEQGIIYYDLSKVESLILRFCDRMDLVLTAKNELAMGNITITHLLDKATQMVTKIVRDVQATAPKMSAIRNEDVQTSDAVFRLYELYRQQVDTRTLALV